MICFIAVEIIKQPLTNCVSVNENMHFLGQVPLLV